MYCSEIALTTSSYFVHYPVMYLVLISSIKYACFIALIKLLTTGQYPWPSLAEVNTRARRYISAWLKQQRRDEHKQAQLVKVSHVTEDGGKV